MSTAQGFSSQAGLASIVTDSQNLRDVFAKRDAMRERIITWRDNAVRNAIANQRNVVQYERYNAQVVAYNEVLKLF